MNLYGRPRAYHPDRPATSAERQRVFARKRAEELCRLRSQLASRVYHQATKTDVGTPWSVFWEYDAEFHFTLDVCATADNAKCVRYFSPEQDGLVQDWGRCRVLDESPLRSHHRPLDGQGVPQLSGRGDGPGARPRTHGHPLVACLGAGEGRDPLSCRPYYVRRRGQPGRIRLGYGHLSATRPLVPLPHARGTDGGHPEYQHY